jgi:small GTP-binding protein
MVHRSSHHEIVELLLKNSRINLENALFSATLGGNRSLALILLNRGANPLFKKVKKTTICCNLTNIEKNGKSCAEIATGECISLFKDLKQIKVLVLGKENVGKTTLVRRIIGDWGISSRLRSLTIGSDVRTSTDGIEMKQWKLKELENTIVYFWDFAGQELYYTTHQFFLTENSINLIVFDCTKSLDENRILFWLNSIQSMAPGSQVIIIGSFKDQLSDSKDRIQILEKISEDIRTLIELWQVSISISQRLKFHGCHYMGKDLLFWPLSCTKSSDKTIVSIYQRYEHFLFDLN